MAMAMTDFGNSYMTWVAEADLTDTRQPGHQPWGNSARILIDARCTITDDRAGTTEELYLIAPCRTEWMYNERDLIQNPSGEYRVIFTQQRQLAVGKHIAETKPRPASVSTASFTSLRFDVRSFATTTTLTTDAEVVAATEQLLPINCRTELAAPERGLRATLEYPIRTMNIHPARVRFQVDTGPLIFPDLATAATPWIDSCYLAHTVFNTFDAAEFVCKQPTPLDPAQPDGPRVFHYSKYVTLPATHTFVCAGELA